MTMFLNEEQEMLADSARRFMNDAAPVSHARSLRDADDPNGFSRDLWRQFADMGFAGVLVTEDDGGLGLGHTEAGVILEEIGRNLTPSPFLSTAVGAVTALSNASAAARQQWLPGIVAGETVAAIAVDEGARHRPHHVETRADARGNGFVLNGAKQAVIHGHTADVLIVSARTAGGTTDASGISLFAVPRTASGVTIEADRLVDSAFATRVRLDGVEVDGDALLGEVDQGGDALASMLRALRAGASGEMTGVASGAFDMTLDYLRERKQFDQVIGSFQALQHRAAHLYSEIEVTRAAVLKAQQLLDAGGDEAEDACLVAKAMAGMTSSLAVREGVQLHGGIGMTDEYDIGLFMKRQRVLAELYGDADNLADELAKRSGY